MEFIKGNLPKLNIIEDDKTNSISNYLKDSQERLKNLFQSGASGRWLNDYVTNQYDNLIISLFQNYSSLYDEVCLVGIGGYGRAEMSPYSDVDLLLLHKGCDEKKVKKLIDRIIYPLWDVGVDIGGATRTVPECMKIAQEDIRSLTSMMNARFLVGNRSLFNDLCFEIEKHFSKKKHVRTYIDRKLSEHRRRLIKYGDSVFVSEPHIKEGEGGLRCYHTAFWISQVRYGVKSPNDFMKNGPIDGGGLDEWCEALDFIWRVRHGIHLSSKRKQDRLDYDYQEILANIMGFNNGDAKIGLENFMHNFYKRASYIHLATERLIGSAKPQGIIKNIRTYFSSYKLGNYIIKKGDFIYITEPGKLQNHPEIAFDAWQAAHKYKLRVHYKSKAAIKSAALSWNNLSENVDVSKRFRNMICFADGFHNVLLEMHETGVLSKLIPEFQNLYHRVQYDAYHLYTVDIHTFFLIRELSRLADGTYSSEFPDFCKAFKNVEKKYILIMAGLLHDIGKGHKSDERHDHRGARMARKIMLRLGFNDDDQKLVEFLVKSHLVLPQIAFLRDIDDSQLIENLAHSLKTSDNLLMLHLLAFADIRATGPKLWSSWKGELLKTLYSKTYDLLKNRGFTAMHVEEEMERKKSKLYSIIEDNQMDAAKEWFKNMPVRYILGTPILTIANHFKTIQKLDENALEMNVIFSPNNSYHVLTVITKDAPGIFSRICEVFSAHNISILEAQLYTGENGDVVDLFKVVSASGRKIRRDFGWEKVERELKETVSKRNEDPHKICNTKHAIRDTLSRNSRISLRRQRHNFVTKVFVDNDVSAYYTVLEIHAPDKVGLLLTVANWLYANNYDIFMAKATTHVGQAIDIFYIRDTNGKKVEDKRDINKIKGIFSIS